MHVLATDPDPEVVRLPWHLPLEEWEGPWVLDVPRGLSRHVVRVVRAGDRIVAVKETTEEMARREYSVLRELVRAGLPVVKPQGVVTGRRTPAGEPLPSALVTRHLRWSMPYRLVVQMPHQTDELERIVDALVVLLVRLHLAGFYWGDVSLSNVLFRRNAGELSAYLVDAETGEFVPHLGDARREYDVDVGTENVFGELLDLQGAGVLALDTDPEAIALHLRDRYTELWTALTAVREFATDEMWQIERWVEDLHCRGFDVEEMDIVTTDEGRRVRLRPVVVEAGHHARQLKALTGLEAEEAQASRLLQDIAAFAAHLDMTEQPREMVAMRWLVEIYRPLISMMPPEMAASTPPAQFFHEVLVHRWYLSEQAGQEIDTFEAARDLIERFGSDIAASGVRDPAG
jgi:hypothetical protein